MSGIVWSADPHLRLDIIFLFRVQVCDALCSLLSFTVRYELWVYSQNTIDRLRNTNIGIPDLMVVRK